MKSKVNTYAARLVSELFRPVVMDESAETIAELAEKWRVSRPAASARVLQLIEAGKIERVYKKGRLRPTPAYRIPRHGKPNA